VILYIKTAISMSCILGTIIKCISYTAMFA